jgi:poly-gamma-glutamate synthase PgsB/CapB
LTFPKPWSKIIVYYDGEAFLSFITVLLALLVGAGIIEYLYHRVARGSVPIRIHINGSRGKSSVTRLIAAGLRTSGKRVIAKTTGSAPRIIFEDGSEKPIPRRGKPNIRELVDFFRIVKRRKADAVVVECMAILPELQRVTEHTIMRSTIGVITNVRPDHIGEMGETLEEIAESLSFTIPRSAVLFSQENRFADLFSKKANRLRTDFNPVISAEPTALEMRHFPYVEHKENVAIALSVCEYLGVARAQALQGMHHAEPDIGVLRIHRIIEDGKIIEFVNAFSANDPESIALIWEKVKKRHEQKIVLVNTRRDRIIRSNQLGELVARQIDAHHYIVTGTFVKAFISSALKAGIPREKIENLEGRSVETIYRAIKDRTEERAIVFAMGNFVNFGWEITNYFAERAEEIAYSTEL